MNSERLSSPNCYPVGNCNLHRLMTSKSLRPPGLSFNPGQGPKPLPRSTIPFNHRPRLCPFQAKPLGGGLCPFSRFLMSHSASSSRKPNLGVPSPCPGSAQERSLQTPACPEQRILCGLPLTRGLCAVDGIGDPAFPQLSLGPCDTHRPLRAFSLLPSAPQPPGRLAALPVLFFLSSQIPGDPASAHFTLGLLPFYSHPTAISPASHSFLYRLVALLFFTLLQTFSKGSETRENSLANAQGPIAEMQALTVCTYCPFTCEYFGVHFTRAFKDPNHAAIFIPRQH